MEPKHCVWDGGTLLLRSEISNSWERFLECSRCKAVCTFTYGDAQGGSADVMNWTEPKRKLKVNRETVFLQKYGKELLMWADDVAQRFTELRKNGARFGADNSDSLYLLKKTVDKIRERA